jgi:hypothetical protein
MQAAASAGLPTRRLQLSSEPQLEKAETQDVRRVLVLGGKIASEDPREWADEQALSLIEGCRRLALLSRTDLIECVFTRQVRAGDAEWILNGATSFPTSLSKLEIDAVASLLEHRAAHPFVQENA